MSTSITFIECCKGINYIKYLIEEAIECYNDNEIEVGNALLSLVIKGIDKHHINGR